MDEMDKRACALEDQQERGFWAVIPAAVLHDTGLRPAAVRLYGEIMLLTRDSGCCWASNQRLGAPYGTAEETVSRLVAELAKAGHIRVVYERNEMLGGTMRKIYPAGGQVDQTVKACQNNQGLTKQSSLDENVKHPLTKTSTYISASLYNNNLQDNDKKQVRKTKQDSARAREAVEAYFVAELGDDAEIRQRVKDFLDGREEKKHPMTSLRAAKVAVGKLKRYSAGEDGTVCRAVLLATMDETIEGCWDSFYPLHEDRRQALLGGGKPEKVAGCYPEL